MRRKREDEKGILGLLEVEVQFKEEEENEHVVLDVLEVEVKFKEEGGGGTGNLGCVGGRGGVQGGRRRRNR